MIIRGGGKEAIMSGLGMRIGNVCWKDHGVKGCWLLIVKPVASNKADTRVHLFNVILFSLSV